MTNKDDEILKQLDAIKKELQESKQQTASTIALNHKESRPFGSFLRVGSKKWNAKIIAFVAIVLIIGTIIGVSAFKFFSSTSMQIEKGSFIDQMKELSVLATSQAFVKAVIEKEDNQLFGKEISTNIPGTKRKLLLIVPGTVTAGVDLQGIEEKDVIVNEEEKTIQVTLPHAHIIQEPSLDFDQIKTFSVEGIFRQDVDWNEGYELADEATMLVKEEAIAQGLLEMAEKNAEKTFKEFFIHLGYDVNVEFKAELP